MSFHFRWQVTSHCSKQVAAIFVVAAPTENQCDRRVKNQDQGSIRSKLLPVPDTETRGGFYITLNKVNIIMFSGLTSLLFGNKAEEINSENLSNPSNYLNLTFKTKEDNGWVVVSGKKKRRKPSNEFNDFMAVALEDVPPAHSLDTSSDFEMDCELNSSPVVSPPPETVPSTPSTPSSLAHLEPEGSWYVTPPPCFTAGSLVNATSADLSPMENLLIEHPSMSVYQRSQIDSLKAELLDAPPPIAPVKTNNQLPPSGNVKAGSSRKVQINHDPPADLSLRERSQLLLMQVLKHEQMTSEGFGRSTNLETVKNLCRNRMARNNKIREFASAGRHKSRKDRMRSPSGANNNRKC